jgi:hypothetical protein
MKTITTLPYITSFLKKITNFTSKINNYSNDKDKDAISGSPGYSFAKEQKSLTSMLEKRKMAKANFEIQAAKI